MVQPPEPSGEGAALELMRSLQELRASGHLCDVALLGKGDGAKQPYMAHQAVLAAASKPLRNYFVSSKAATEFLPSPPLPQELRLAGLVSPEEAALRTLQHIYCGASVVTADGSAIAPDLGKLGRALNI